MKKLLSISTLGKHLLCAMFCAVLVLTQASAQTKKECKCKCHKHQNPSTPKYKTEKWEVIGTRTGASLFQNYFYLVYKRDNEFYEKQVPVYVYDYYYKKLYLDKE